nr:Gfo/Idh/MocA family oxidoreductase [Paenibacillus shirakamiensis]
MLVGHTQHYWPANLQAKKLIESGRLGPLIAIQDTRHLPYFSEERPRWFLEKAKSGGGILMNLGAHSIDKIQFLTSSRVDRISASMTKYGSIGDVEGSSVLFLTTSTGVAATIVQSGYLGKPLDLTELIFTGGRARLISSAGLWVSEGQEFEIESLDALEDPFIRMYQDLVQEIEEKKPPGSSGMYARSVIAAIEAAYLSHDEGAERKIDPFK